MKKINWSIVLIFCCLIIVFSCKNNNKQVKITGNINDFKSYIKTLNDSDLQSIYLIKDYISKIDKNEFKDSLYIPYEQFCYTVAEKYSNIVYNDTALVSKIHAESKDKQLTNLQTQLDTLGMQILIQEGIPFVDFKADFFYNSLKTKVSESMLRFLEIKKHEMSEGFSADAALMISFEDLYNRAIMWEEFDAKYPNFILKDVVNYNYVSYLMTLFIGLDNTSAFDYQSKKLLPEIKALYEKIINNKVENKTNSKVKEYYEILKKSDFKESTESETFLKSINANPNQFKYN